MVINKELLQLRKKIADKRPEFVRQESGDMIDLHPIGEDLKVKITR